MRNCDAELGFRCGGRRACQDQPGLAKTAAPRQRRRTSQGCRETDALPLTVFGRWPWGACWITIPDRHLPSDYVRGRRSCQKAERRNLDKREWVLFNLQQWTHAVQRRLMTIGAGEIGRRHAGTIKRFVTRVLNSTKTRFPLIQ